MGTRAGDLDPAILTHLLHDGMTLSELERMLYHEAGLKALAGTADMRELLRRSDAAAALALDIFCTRIRKYIGAFLAVLEGAEALVFTGGIGENAPEIRERVCSGFGLGRADALTPNGTGGTSFGSRPMDRVWPPMRFPRTRKG